VAQAEQRSLQTSSAHLLAQNPVDGAAVAVNEFRASLAGGACRFVKRQQKFHALSRLQINKV
jgi:hypothetical protein